MNWLALLTAILPLIQKIIELFTKTDPAKLTARQRMKLGQLRTACQQFEAHAAAAGVAAVPLEAMADHEE